MISESSLRDFFSVFILLPDTEKEKYFNSFCEKKYNQQKIYSIEDIIKNISFDDLQKKFISHIFNNLLQNTGFKREFNLINRNNLSIYEYLLNSDWVKRHLNEKEHSVIILKFLEEKHKNLTNKEKNYFLDKIDNIDFISFNETKLAFLYFSDMTENQNQENKDLFDKILSKVDINEENLVNVSHHHEKASIILFNNFIKKIDEQNIFLFLELLQKYFVNYNISDKAKKILTDKILNQLSNNCDNKKFDSIKFLFLMNNKDSQTYFKDIINFIEKRKTDINIKDIFDFNEATNKSFKNLVKYYLNNINSSIDDCNELYNYINNRKDLNELQYSKVMNFLFDTNLQNVNDFNIKDLKHICKNESFFLNFSETIITKINFNKLIEEDNFETLLLIRKLKNFYDFAKIDFSPIQEKLILLNNLKIVGQSYDQNITNIKNKI